jgi:hypothetical protein
MTPKEIASLVKHLRKTFQTEAIEIKKLPKKKDTAELYVADEFVGVIYRDEDEGEVSYQVQIAILETDLD